MKKIHKYEKITDLKDMLTKSAEKFADKPAYIYKTETPGEFRKILYKELKEQVDGLGTMLINMGLEGKRIAVIGENRYEWNVAY